MSDAARGAIYDLGYQPYTGARLGRRHAVLSMYIHNLRMVFGLGRPVSSKVAPWLLVAAAFIPAVVQAGFGAIQEASADIELIVPEEYYTYVQLVLAIFVAVVAPELAGRDQRSRTLSLYFSRAIERDDYALAKYAALVTGMLLLTLGPQVLLFVGNGLTLDDAGGYARDNWNDLPAAAASALLVSMLLAGIGLAIAAQTPRRAYSTIAIVALLVVSSVIGITLVESVESDLGRYGVMISQFDLAQGLTYWFFGAEHEADSAPGRAGLWGGTYAIVAAVVSLLCLAVVLRRYRSIQA
jgi:ABC-2 type transport system permease protein